MDEDFLNDVIEEASKRYRQWCSVTIRGQMIMPQDGFEYWVALVTRERVLEEVNFVNSTGLWRQSYCDTKTKLDAAMEEIAELRASLRDCAEDLADIFGEQWQFRGKYPSMMKSYERDMEPVYTARKLLGEE